MRWTGNLFMIDFTRHPLRITCPICEAVLWCACYNCELAGRKMLEVWLDGLRGITPHLKAVHGFEMHPNPHRLTMEIILDAAMRKEFS